MVSLRREEKRREEKRREVVQSFLPEFILVQYLTALLRLQIILPFYSEG